MNKKKSQALEKIASEVAICEICKEHKTGLPVPGEGNSEANILFVGEAPGRTEAEIGQPFVGRSGKLLTRLIEEIGLTRNVKRYVFETWGYVLMVDELSFDR